MSSRRLRLATLGGAFAIAATLMACGGKRGVEASALTLSAAPPGATMRAGYLTVTNHGTRTRVLANASSNAYEIVEFHISETVDGVARMREETHLALAPGATLSFEPYGRHLMLMRPTAAATKEALSVELCFADGECITAGTSAATPP